MSWRKVMTFDRAAYWYAYTFGDGSRYVIDVAPEGGRWTATFESFRYEQQLAPGRKSLAAALNDCKRHARKRRAALVEFGDSKL